MQEEHGSSSDGENTPYILMEINRTSQISHSYPCSESKAKSCKTFKEKKGEQLWFDEYEHDNPEEEIEIKLYHEL